MVPIFCHGGSYIRSLAIAQFRGSAAAVGQTTVILGGLLHHDESMLPDSLDTHPA